MFTLSWLTAVFFLVVGLSARQVWAAPGVVVVVRAVGVVETTPYELRLRSELRTEGIDAVVINVNTPNSESKALAGRFGVYGVIDVTLSRDEATAWVWVSDPAVSLEITRSIKVNLTQRDSVAVFALRSVDLYVGAKLELEQQGRSRTPAPLTPDPATVPKDAIEPSPLLVPPFVAAPAEPKVAEKAKNTGDSAANSTNRSRSADSAPSAPSAPDRNSAARQRVPRLRVGGGVAIMQYTDKLQRRIAPSLFSNLSLSKKWSMGLTLTGPFVATILLNVNGEGQASPTTIDQEYLWIDGRYRWSLSDQFELEPALGLGIARYGVSAESGETYVARGGAVVSFLTSFGGALVWRVGPKVRLMTEVVCLARWQTPLVMVDDRDETGTSLLNFWGSFGPAWVF